MAASTLRIPRNLSHVWFKIMGANTRGTGPSILLVGERNRYLFNCEEGLERLYSEISFPKKLRALRGIFLTQPLWERFSAIYSYSSLRLLSEMGEKEGLDFQIVSAYPDKLIGCLMEKPHMKVPKNLETYEDEEVLIEPILIRKVSSGTKKPATRNPPLKSRSIPNEEMLVSYYGELSDVRGNVDLEVLEKCGIEASHGLVGKLRRGQNVVSPSGRVLKPEDCIGPTITGASFLIIECPNKEFISPIVKNERLESLRTSRNRILKVLVHLVPKSVASTQEYLNWMKSFDSKTEHLVVLTDVKDRIANHGYKMRCILNLVSPSLYPITKQDEKMVAKIPGMCENMHIVDDLCHYHLHRSTRGELECNKNSFELLGIPKQSEVMQNIYKDLEENFNFNKIRVYKQQLVNTVGNTNKQLTQVTPLQHYKEFIDSPPKPELTPLKRDPIVLFLGTGSTYCTSHRSTSCVLIIDADRNSYMLDCGEGAYAQMCDRFGEATNEILASLKLIFVSHRHTDHHSGLIRLLNEREKLIGQRGGQLLVLGPTILSEKLRFYSDNCAVLNYRFIKNGDLESGLSEKVLRELSLRQLQAVRVRHCFDSFGVSLVHQEGWKVVYSGDTRPVDELVRVGQECDLLIHEATFENEMVDHAKLKKHSTTQEAIRVSQKMRAKFTILTHFSSRYSRLPQFEEAFVSQNVAVAFDMMSVRLSQLPSLIEAQKLVREIAPKFLKQTCHSEDFWNSVDSWDPYEDEEDY